MKRLFSILFLMFLLVNVNLPSANAATANTVDMSVRTYSLTAASGNSFSEGDIGYINSSGQVVLASALNSVTANGLLVMATETVSGGSAGTFRILEGDYTGASDLNIGATYYLDVTSGAYTSVAPTGDGTIKLPLGKAISSTRLVFGPINLPVSVNTTTDSTGGTTTPSVTTPTVESISSAFESDGTITTTAPADIEAGDMLLLFAATDETDATETTYTPPAGFSTLVAQQRGGSGGEGTDFGSWYKVAGTSETATYDLGESELNNTATVMLRVAGLDPDNVLDTSSCSTGTAEPVTAPSIDVTVDDALVLTVFAWDGSKTVVLEPSGFTTAIHNDQSAVDLWVGYKTQAVSGASGTNVMDISSDDDWVACTIALKEPNATSTSTGGGGAGGGASSTEGAGPYSVLDDGTPAAVPMKLTLPIACDGTFVGSACEIFPNNDSHWEVGDPDLATYEHPTYFIRDPNYYTFCSPNTGATTSTAKNGRSEKRLLQNHNSGVVKRQYVFRVKDDQVVNGLKANIGQWHRGGTESSPNFKGTYTHTVVRANTAQSCTSTTIVLDASASASDDTYNGMGITLTGGTNYLNNNTPATEQVRHITDYVGSTRTATVSSAWDNNCSSDTTYEIGNGIYRVLSKKTNGASDFSFNNGLGEKVVLDKLVSNSFIRVYYEYDMDNETLEFWVSDDEDNFTDTILSGDADLSLTGVTMGAGAYAYEKIGMYMNSAGDGSNSTPYCAQIWQYEYVP